MSKYHLHIILKHLKTKYYHQLFHAAIVVLLEISHEICDLWW